MKENGLINVCKPEGWTSQDVCAKLRKRFGTRRVGHIGTLDPMATGVLPVAFGKATRIIEYFDADLKIYRAELKLGVVTDTFDITGNVLEESDFSDVSAKKIMKALKTFKGEIMQTPPIYSALKVDGKRLYEYAREGKEVEIKQRPVNIIGISDVIYDLEAGKVEFTVACSKGTYIRAICHDIGQMLGCGACMTSLIRISSGHFNLMDSFELDRILSMDDEELAGIIIDMDEPLENIGSARLLIDESKFLHGMMISHSEIYIDRMPELPENVRGAEALKDVFKVYSKEGKFLGTSKLDRETGVHKPEKVIASAE